MTTATPAATAAVAPGLGTVHVAVAGPVIATARLGRSEPADLRRIAEHAETAQLDEGEDREQVRGYGVIGVPFAGGDVLAMRRFPASSIGPGYTSVWHRQPGGRWVFYQDQDPLAACPRAFGPAIDEAITTDIALEWTHADTFVVGIRSPVELRWRVHAESTPTTRALSALASRTPASMRRSRAFAAAAGRVTGALLGAGRLRLRGEVPSRQAFHADMRAVLIIDDTDAVIDGRDLGDPAPLPEQVHLGDFWIPQRGLFAVGDGLFERYDPVRHLCAPTRHEVAAR